MSYQKLIDIKIAISTQIPFGELDLFFRLITFSFENDKIEDCLLGITRTSFHKYLEQMIEEDLGTFIWLSDCICENRVE